MGKKIVALAGQPNCGKSTVFNSLTGARQFVANYPGVTVDKMMGWYKRDGETVEVVDLPGTYSMTSYSPEERVSRDVLLKEPLSAGVNAGGAAHPKRTTRTRIRPAALRNSGGAGASGRRHLRPGHRSREPDPERPVDRLRDRPRTRTGSGRALHRQLPGLR